MELIALRAIRQVVARLKEGRAEAQKSASWSRILSPRPTASGLGSTGVDMVVHSPRKDVGGFGTEMGGAVIGSGTNCNLLMLYRKDFALSPKNACPILVYSLPTPAARMVNQQRELAHRPMTTPDGSCARPRAVF